MWPQTEESLSSTRSCFTTSNLVHLGHEYSGLKSEGCDLVAEDVERCIHKVFMKKILRRDRPSLASFSLLIISKRGVVGNVDTVFCSQTYCYCKGPEVGGSELHVIKITYHYLVRSVARSCIGGPHNFRWEFFLSLFCLQTSSKHGFTDTCGGYTTRLFSIPSQISVDW